MEFAFNYKNFYDFIAEKKYSKLVEVGVWRGESVAYLDSKIMGNEHKIYAVDLFEDTDDTAIKKCADNETISNIREIFYSNTKRSDTVIDIKGISWEIAKCFDDDSVDFVFIDACHEYDSVKKDILAWLPKVRSGGIISGHDYSKRWSGVQKAVNELCTNINLPGGSVWWMHK